MNLDEIAKKAGVSKAAVSFALNNKSGVSPATREKIISIAREMGYIPRTLVNTDELYRNTKYIRFLAVPESDVVSTEYQEAPFFMELIHHVERYVRQTGFALTITNLDKHNFLGDQVDLEVSHPSSGTILLATNLSEIEAENIASVQPMLVVLDTLYEHSSINCIVMNNVQGAFAATRFLLDLGHTKIGYVASKTRIKNFELRRQGFLDALGQKKLEEGGLVCRVHPYIENSRLDFSYYLEKNNRDLPTAFFCENDYIAIGTIKALQDKGIAVPADVSVIGFDDIPQAAVITPELTTMRVDKATMAEVAVERLIELINGKRRKTPMLSIIDTELIVRGSCREIH